MADPHELPNAPFPTAQAARPVVTAARRERRPACQPKPALRGRHRAADLDALVSLAKALHVSPDDLVFDEDERGPSDDMRLQFEAVSQLPEEDRKIVKALIEGVVIKYQARRMVENLSS